MGSADDERGGSPATGPDEPLEISVDRDVCMGSGNCAFSAPGVFELDDDGVATVVDASAATEEAVLVAARGCPTQAITLRRGDRSVHPPGAI